MCIICTCPKNGQKFIDSFSDAQKAMKETAKYMLACSREEKEESVRKSYSRTHKQMVRLIREWNKLEHTREKSDFHN